MHLKPLVLASCCSFACLPLAAVTPGNSVDQVLAEKGPPASKLERGTITVFTYPDAIIRLEGGRVLEVKPVGADYAVRATAAGSTSARAVARSAGQWVTDYSAARAEARVTHRRVFLLFTGSDWCIWCKRLEGEILSQPAFADFARDHLVLVKLDFPNHTPQAPELKAQNQKLAQHYGIQGYPTVIVLDPAGTKLGEMGYMKGGPEPFLAKLGRL